jgi:hypothetical protein
VKSSLPTARTLSIAGLTFIALCSGALLSTSQLHAADAAEAAGSATAEQMMIRAHQNRASWDGMVGFSADVLVSNNGEQVEGTVTIRTDGEIDLILPEDFSSDWVHTKLASLVQHRQAPRENFDVSFADEVKNHPLGRLIKFNDDPAMGSHYRIDGDVITEVHRNMGKTRFTISVTDVTRNAQGKYLPKSYSLSFWNAESDELVSTMNVHDDWITVEGRDLPARLLSIESDNQGGRDVREIRFRNHRLLPVEQTAGR